MISIRRGLDLPISGEPKQEIQDAPKVRSVGLVGPDYHGMKPSMSVQVGDRVAKGQVLFTDRKNEGVLFTAPAAGTVSAINRGAKRVLQSVVIDVDGDEEVTFDNVAAGDLDRLDRATAVELLRTSGLWTAFRSRPYSRVPALDAMPSSIFVSAIDNGPGAPDPAVVLKGAEADYENGLHVLTRLAPTVFAVSRAGSATPRPSIANVRHEEFSGPHPSGLAGTHIHFLDPVNERKSVWTINCQDVVAIGKLFTTGKLDTSRVVALTGPAVDAPRLVRSTLGASLDELTAGQCAVGENRVISGDVLAGRATNSNTAYLGRYHQQVSVLPEGRERVFMGWLSSGANRHSLMRIYLSKLMSGKKFAMTTSTNGSERAIVPIGAYEKVMPLDILATPLLKYLVVGDTDMAIKLGALELDEEDLALCTYVCPGKYEYGPILRENLTRIELEA